MKLRWLVIAPNGIDVVQILTDNSAESYMKIYDWAIIKWNGKQFAIVPFNDEHVETVDFTTNE